PIVPKAGLEGTRSAPRAAGSCAGASYGRSGADTTQTGYRRAAQARIANTPSKPSIQIIRMTARPDAALLRSALPKAKERPPTRRSFCEVGGEIPRHWAKHACVISPASV